MVKIFKLHILVFKLQFFGIISRSLSKYLKSSYPIFLNEKLAQSREGGYSKIWKTTNKLPLALMGAYVVGDKKLEGFFVASKLMDERKHSLKITFELRQLLKEQTYIYKGWTLGLYSESKQVENQLSWLRLIGFQYTPSGNRGNTRYFEYTSRIN